MKTIYHNGRVFPGRLPLLQAFAVQDGRFLAAGTDGEILSLAEPGDVLQDLEGKFVCPGFNDSHMHLLNFGYSMELCDLAGADSLENLLARLEAFPGREWILGRGWNQDLFSPATGMPTRRDLDRLTAEKPVCIVRCCGHCLAVNSRALALLGIDGNTPQVPGGSFDTDDAGEPTGIFRDNAMGLVLSRLPLPDREDMKRMLRNACKVLNGCGITSCQTDDLLAFEGVPWEEVLAAYRELEAAGELTVRITQQSQFTTPEGLGKFLQKGGNTGVGSDLFRIGPLKLLGDGSLGARTAFLSKDYADAPGQRGIAIFSQAEFDEMIGLAHRSGMQVAVHAIGDGILDRVLSAFEKAFADCPRQDHRSGIVHAQITRRDQLEKMKALGLHAWVQTVFLDYDSRIVRRRVGDALADTSYAFGTMAEMGISFSNGTDCPVEQPQPMRGIRCAVTRQCLDGSLPPYRPEEALTMEEALRSYTVSGARATFEEEKKGEIRPGMLADFAVLSGNPFACPPEELTGIRTEATFLEGRCVWHSGIAGGGIDG